MRLDQLLERTLGGNISETVKDRLKEVLDGKAGEQAAQSYGRALTKSVDTFAGRAFEEMTDAATLEVANGLATSAAAALEAAAVTLRDYPRYAVAVEAARADRTALRDAQNTRKTAQDQLRADLMRALRALAGED